MGYTDAGGDKSPTNSSDRHCGDDPRYGCRHDAVKAEARSAHFRSPDTTHRDVVRYHPRYPT